MMLWETTQSYGRHHAPQNPPILVPDAGELAALLVAVVPFAAHPPTLAPQQIHLESRPGELSVSTANEDTWFRATMAVNGRAGLFASISPGAALDLARTIGATHRRRLPVELSLVDVYTSTCEVTGSELLARSDGAVVFACEADAVAHVPYRLVLATGTWETGTVLP